MSNLIRNISRASKIQLAENKAKDKKIEEARKAHKDELLKTDPAYAIAVDYSAALDGVLSGDRDVLDVVREFEDRINAAQAGGAVSPVFSTIKQQLPKISDLGLLAANKVDIEDVIAATESKKSEQNKPGDNIIPDLQKKLDAETDPEKKKALQAKIDAVDKGESDECSATDNEKKKKKFMKKEGGIDPSGKAFKDGKNNAESGGSIDENPYEVGSDEYNNWEEGHDAREVEKGESKKPEQVTFKTGIMNLVNKNSWNY